MYLNNDIISTLNTIFDKKDYRKKFISACDEAISFSKQKKIKTKPYVFGDKYVMSFEVSSIVGLGFEINILCKERNIDFNLTFSDIRNEWEVVYTKTKGYYLPPDYKYISIKFLQSFIVYQYLVKNYWDCFDDSSDFFKGLGIRKNRIEELSNLCKIKGLNDKPPKKEPDSVVFNKAVIESELGFINVNKFESCRTRQFAKSSGQGNKIVDFLNSDEYDNRKWFYDFYSSKEDMKRAEEKNQTSNLWVMIERLENNVWYMECSNSDNKAITRIKCFIEATTDNNIRICDVEIDHKADDEIENGKIDEDRIKLLHKEFMYWHCIFIYSVLKNDFLVNKKRRGKRNISTSYERNEIMWDASILHKIQKVKKELGLK